MLRKEPPLRRTRVGRAANSEEQLSKSHASGRSMPSTEVQGKAKRHWYTISIFGVRTAVETKPVPKFTDVLERQAQARRNRGAGAVEDAQAPPLRGATLKPTTVPKPVLTDGCRI